jgi:aspartate carbamoyltransferase catalytic subunit
MKTKLAKQIQQVESSITWIDNGMMLRTQKQRFNRLMNQGRVLDAYALIDEYKILNTDI